MIKFQLQKTLTIRQSGLLFVLFLWTLSVCAETIESIDEELIQAAEKGNVPLVKRILEAHSEISEDTINKAFFESIRKGSKPIAQFLISRSADVNYRGDNGYTALIQAARDGRSHLVKLLLPLGANVNDAASETGETALILAAKRNRRDVVNQLLASNADLNVQRSTDGMTALMLAARGGHQLIAHALIEAGAEVDRKLENGATALMLAAQHGHLGVIYVLLAANADVNIKASNGATALTLANVHRHSAAADMLKKAGAR
ncbi:MAG: ankyrin repeat domain-containing protein [Nitrosomonas sp.]|nr:ankyrin repeat domain-containing protein [Nitrosomonas sp.]